MARGGVRENGQAQHSVQHLFTGRGSEEDLYDECYAGLSRQSGRSASREEFPAVTELQPYPADK